MPSTTTATPTNTPTTTNPTNSTNKPDQESGRYQRVYADWKPSKTLEQTDVVANLQAIADAQPAPDALRQYRRQRSQDQQSPGVLQSIAEEDRRKSYIQKMGDRDMSNESLKVYIRRSSSRDLMPAKKEEPLLPPKSPKPQVSDDTFASLLSHHKSQNEMQASSKEVDADNIETPPVSRRVIATPTTTVVTVSMTDKPKAPPEDKISLVVGSAEQDAPGHFDRHALGRRTRRYKRPTDYSSGNEEHLTSSKPEVKASPSKAEQPAPAEKSKQKERTITKLEKVGRHISSINQEDVREAIRNLKSPTGTPERPWSPPREITPSKLKLSASGHHELNDEGFEETQSLVSDTPSHGKGESTNSSCNEGVNESTPARQRPLQKQKATPTSLTQMGSRLADRLQQARMKGSGGSSAATPATKSQNQLPATQTATVKRSLSASRPLRMPNGQPLASAAPLRSASAVRRSPQEQQVLAGVERSSSRNSLRSSRSSINSGASTQTVVRRLPAVQRAGATVSVDSSPSKRPLAAQNMRPTPGRGVPASRSSSSGSSVGPSVILVRSKMTNTAPRTNISGSTSFKENQSQSQSQPQSQSRMSAARSVVLVKNAMNQQQQARMGGSPSNQQQRSSSSTRSVSSFMRPTASSATKRQK